MKTLLTTLLFAGTALMAQTGTAPAAGSSSTSTTAPAKVKKHHHHKAKATTPDSPATNAAPAKK
jgi:L-serine deaminase